MIKMNFIKGRSINHMDSFLTPSPAGVSRLFAPVCSGNPYSFVVAIPGTSMPRPSFPIFLFCKRFGFLFLLLIRFKLTSDQFIFGFSLKAGYSKNILLYVFRIEKKRYSVTIFWNANKWSLNSIAGNLWFWHDLMLRIEHLNLHFLLKKMKFKY